MTKKQVRADVLRSIVYGLEVIQLDATNAYTRVMVDDAHDVMGRVRVGRALEVVKKPEFDTINHEIWEIVYGPEDKMLDRTNNLIKTVSGWIQ